MWEIFGEDFGLVKLGDIGAIAQEMGLGGVRGVGKPVQGRWHGSFWCCHFDWDIRSVRPDIDFPVLANQVCTDGFVGAGETVDVPFADIYLLLPVIYGVHLTLEVLSHRFHLF